MPLTTVDIAPASGHGLAEAFACERRALIFGRLSGAALFALFPIGLGAVLNLLVFSDRLPQRLATFGVEGGLCLGVLAVGRSRIADRHALGVALAFVLGMLTCLLWAVSLSPADLDVLVCPVASTMVACTLLFPWGIGPQMVASLYTIGGYLWLVPWGHLGPDRVTNIALGLALGGTTSVIGALILDRQRRATFIERERVATLAHQRELLLDAGRDLTGTVALPDLIDRIVHHGRRLLGTHSAWLMLLDELAAAFRPVAVSSLAPDPSDQDVIGMEFPVPTFDFLLQEMRAHGAVQIPGGTPCDVLQEVLLHRFRAVRTLYVGIQRDGQMFGFLAFMHRDPTAAFGDQELRLADGIASQAAIALANARLIDALRTANRVKSEFVSTMSHELRTPLHVILGYTDMLEDLPDDERPATLARVRTAGAELLDMIQATLDLNRMEAGRDVPTFAEVSLAEMWDELTAEYGAIPRKPGVALRWEPAPAFDLCTDRRKLKIVIKNLVGNALKFTPAGAVVVAVHVTAEAVVFSVHDTGVGIPRDALAVIFEMFRQVDSSDTRSFGGAGLGLYIVRRLVEQLGGTIRVESEPGRGSTFTVSLPRAVPADALLRAAG